MADLSFPKMMRHADYASTKSESHYHGRHRLALPSGEQLTVDQANISAVAVVVTNGGAMKVNLVLGDTEEERGFYQAMPPQEARQMAQHLNKLADEVEAGHVPGIN